MIKESFELIEKEHVPETMQGGSAKKTKKNADKTVVEKSAEASSSKAGDEPPKAKSAKTTEIGNYFANAHLKSRWNSLINESLV